MPVKRAAAKLGQQLSVPSYSHKSPPPSCHAWLRVLQNSNPVSSTDVSLLSEENLRRTWMDILRSLHLENRTNEINTQAAKAENHKYLASVARQQKLHANSLRSSRSIPAHEEIVKNVDTSDYNPVPLGTKARVGTMRYTVYLEKLLRLSPDKTMTVKVVEACFYRDISTMIKMVGAKRQSAADMVKSAKTVMNQAEAKRYWKLDQEQPNSSAQA